ncbi:hypothetical protein V7S43_016762 [Phytophthora oleae]|uniref:Uncharacterized protein n=1 Tax=Phytophthora oleae TaxID=2107226 RepID=A0ABD3EV50_9STRA
MCMALRDVVSAILSMPWSPRHDEDENDAEQVLTGSSQCTTLASHTSFVTATGGVQVSLVLAVFTRHNASSGLLHQQATARWTFSAADGHFVEFFQEPTQVFRSVTLSVFESYATDLLKFISCRSGEWTIRNKWIWATTTVDNDVVGTTSKEFNYHGEQDDENECTTKEDTKKKRTVNPRYLDYERTWAYSSKRQENLERRRLQQRQRGRQ